VGDSTNTTGKKKKTAHIIKNWALVGSTNTTWKKKKAQIIKNWALVGRLGLLPIISTLPSSRPTYVTCASFRSPFVHLTYVHDIHRFGNNCSTRVLLLVSTSDAMNSCMPRHVWHLGRYQ
jgi:hypothetical protein